MKVLIFTILLSFLLIACGPGALDGQTHISKGYYFSYMGGEQNVIDYKGDERRNEIVIDSSVIQFFLYKSIIYASRRPIVYEKVGDISRTKGKGLCEYWTIDILTHEINGPISKSEKQVHAIWKELINSSFVEELKARNLECSLA